MTPPSAGTSTGPPACTLVEEVPLSGGWVGDARRGPLADGRAGRREADSPSRPTPRTEQGLALWRRPGCPCLPCWARGPAPGVDTSPVTPTGRASAGAIAQMHPRRRSAFGSRRDNHAGRFVQERRPLAPGPASTPSAACAPTWATPACRRTCGGSRRACDGPLPDLLPAPVPSLTHGDLSRGNVVDGRWLVDPEVSFADREFDLAFHADVAQPARSSASSRKLPFEAGYNAPVRAGAAPRLLQLRHFDPASFPSGIEAHRPLRS